MKTAIVAFGLGATLLTVSAVQLADKELAAIEGGTDVHYNFAQQQSVVVGIQNENNNLNTNVASAVAEATGGSIAIEVLPITVTLTLPVL